MKRYSCQNTKFSCSSIFGVTVAQMSRPILSFIRFCNYGTRSNGKPLKKQPNFQINRTPNLPERPKMSIEKPKEIHLPPGLSLAQLSQLMKVPLSNTNHSFIR